MTRTVTRTDEESVLVKGGMRVSEMHVVIMTVLVRVVIRVGEMMILVNLERLKDSTASVVGLDYSDKGGAADDAARVEAAVCWKAEHSSNNNNGEFFSSSNFQCLEQPPQPPLYSSPCAVSTPPPPFYW